MDFGCGFCLRLPRRQYRSIEREQPDRNETIHKSLAQLHAAAAFDPLQSGVPLVSIACRNLPESGGDHARRKLPGDEALALALRPFSRPEVDGSRR